MGTLGNRIHNPNTRLLAFLMKYVTITLASENLVTQMHFYFYFYFCWHEHRLNFRVIGEASFLQIAQPERRPHEASVI